MFWAFLVCAALALLYWFGCLPVSMKRAATYLGSGGWGSSCVGASFTACTGKIHRILRFRESRSYSFRLTGHIQQGTVTAEILTPNRQQVLLLTSDNPSGILHVQKGQRYLLFIHFQHASGDYQLDWT